MVIVPSAGQHTSPRQRSACCHSRFAEIHRQSALTCGRPSGRRQRREMPVACSPPDPRQPTLAKPSQNDHVFGQEHLYIGCDFQQACLRRIFEMTDELHSHGLRSAWLSAQLSTQLALPTHQVHAIARAALTHDIGKHALPASLLDKPAPFTPRERRLVERHCLIGAGMLLVDAQQDTAASSTVAVAVALSHHEWWNGQGYPFGLSGDTIPRCGRIVAVADVFDALVSVRPYKLAWSTSAAVDYIVRKSGTQFDPECVDALVRVARDLPTSWQSVARSGLGDPIAQRARTRHQSARRHPSGSPMAAPHATKEAGLLA